MRWILLLHHLPPRPAYLRAMVMRRLRKLGALPVKNSSYLLPETGDVLEDLQWLRREIEGQGGQAWVFRAEFVAGLDRDSVVEAFRALHADAYDKLWRESQMLLGKAGRLSERSSASTQAKVLAQWKSLTREFSELSRIAHFGAARKQDVETVMDKIRQILYRPAEGRVAAPALNQVAGQTWVTRRGIKVDRIGTAWLVRRFVDGACPFMFVDPDQYVHQKGQVRFDMFEGEFTHQGDLCTFEVVLEKLARDDAALHKIAEMVHDIDCKDDKFRRPETAGLAMLIEGIAARHASDEARLAEGLAVFDSLYAQAQASEPRTGARYGKNKRR